MEQLGANVRDPGTGATLADSKSSLGQGNAKGFPGTF